MFQFLMYGIVIPVVLHNVVIEGLHSLIKGAGVCVSMLCILMSVYGLV